MVIELPYMVMLPWWWYHGHWVAIYGDVTLPGNSAQVQAYPPPLNAEHLCLVPQCKEPTRCFSIQFYTSWCEYSQQALPHFLEVFQHIVDTNTSGVYIGKIDVTKHGGERD